MYICMYLWLPLRRRCASLAPIVGNAVLEDTALVALLAAATVYCFLLLPFSWSYIFPYTHMHSYAYVNVELTVCTALVSPLPLLPSPHFSSATLLAAPFLLLCCTYILTPRCILPHTPIHINIYTDVCVCV